MRAATHKFPEFAWARLLVLAVVCTAVGRAGPSGAEPTRNMPEPQLSLTHQPTTRTIVGHRYVVAANGSDKSDGSDAAPWRTLQHAADRVAAGDAVIVKPGTYEAGMNLWHRAGGRPDAPIQFLAESGAVITHCATVGPNAELAAINIEGSDGYVIAGFTIHGDGSMRRAGIRVTGSNDTVIANNVVDRAYIGIFTSDSARLRVEGNTCTRSTDEHGIYMGAGDRDCVVRANRLFGNARDGLHTNASTTAANDGLLIEANVVYDNALSGMDIEGTTRATVRDNVIYANQKHGIVLHSADQADTPACAGNQIVNNTITGNERCAVFIADACDCDNVVANNVLLSRSRIYGSVCLGEPSRVLRCDYNIVVDRFSVDRGATTLSLAAWREASGSDLHSRVVDEAALFVDAAGQDYRIRRTSPSRSAGAPVNWLKPTTMPASPTPSDGERSDIGARVRD